MPERLLLRSSVSDTQDLEQASLPGCLSFLSNQITINLKKQNQRLRDSCRPKSGLEN